jgi:hypothetical protein
MRYLVMSLCSLMAASLLPATASAVPPYFRMVPNTYYGYETTLLQQAYYRYLAQNERAGVHEISPSAPYAFPEGRYITIIGADNNARTFWVEGTRPAARAPAARVPRFGSNR